MKPIYTLIALLLVVFGATYVYMESEAHAQEFVNNGQFEPKYIAYTHDQMLEECIRRGLFYDYEDAECAMEEVVN